MRLVFGALGLLIVLAIVGSLAKRQLQAVGMPTQAVAASAAGVDLPAPSGTPAQQSQQLQRKVADDVNRLMQQAPARVEGGTP
ncbi:hypothetical protein [Methylibium sp.]|uniref:hypothetical protein n=1 Tax=Methylibium sp. TaxID=2067992 RepID=UPI003D0A666E